MSRSRFLRAQDALARLLWDAGLTDYAEAELMSPRTWWRRRSLPWIEWPARMKALRDTYEAHEGQTYSRGYSRGYSAGEEAKTRALLRELDRRATKTTPVTSTGGLKPRISE